MLNLKNHVTGTVYVLILKLTELLHVEVVFVSLVVCVYVYLEQAVKGVAVIALVLWTPRAMLEQAAVFAGLA
jgi:hypothetical protein